MRWTLVMFLVLTPNLASAQAPLNSGLGGLAGFGSSVMPNSDDGSVMVDLTPGFPMGISFYGTTYNSLFINMNGLLTFGSAQMTYADFAFPGLNRPGIGVFYADVDTSPGAQPGDPAGANRVYWDLRAGQLTVTWYLVGYAVGRTDQRNSFQIIIRQRPGLPDGNIEVELRYNQCRWAGAVAPRSTSPGIGGVDRGDGTRFFRFNGSREFTVAMDLCGGTNVGMSGVWRFTTDIWSAAMCGNFRVETGEQCDDGGMDADPLDGCHRCRYSTGDIDAGGIPDVMNRDGGDEDAGMDSGLSGIDGGGGPLGEGGIGDREGGAGTMDGSGGGIDGGGGEIPVGRDVFGGGCAASGARPGLGWLLVLLALVGLRRVVRPQRRPTKRATARM